MRCLVLLISVLCSASKTVAFMRNNLKLNYCVPVLKWKKIAFNVAIMTGAFISSGNYNYAYASSEESQVVRSLVTDGVDLFRKGEFGRSIHSFDLAIKKKPDLEPYLWQRGLALYFDKRFRECSAQFKVDVTVNPRDTEEAIWDYICRSEEPSHSTLHLMKLSEPDKRRVMQLTYEVFQGNVDWYELEKLSSKSSETTYFYSKLYLSLYFHTINEDDKSLAFIREALNSNYALLELDNRDLMISVAKHFEKSLLDRQKEQYIT